MKAWARVGGILVCFLTQVSLGWGQNWVNLAQQRFQVERFPPVEVATNLAANARFHQDTIFLGQIQSDFHTLDDTLSLLYHEYQHYLMKGRFPVAVDDQGMPRQWMVEEFYWYEPSPDQVAREIAQCADYLNSLPQAARDAQLAGLEKSLAVPRKLPFRYAPSNLAREEILAYQSQLAGEQLGHYELSPEARRVIRIRLHQLKGSLAQRVDYEKRHQLGPDGAPLASRDTRP
ncbi:MAG: hypothetical protein AAF804_14825 [Bacteroidota bacterium]